jgi:hypothetical protein
MKRASQTKPPAFVPVLEPLGARTGRTFPTELLSNARCIEQTGHGLATIAARGGLHPCEVARNLTGQAKAYTIAEAEEIIAKALEGYAGKTKPDYPLPQPKLELRRRPPAIQRMMPPPRDLLN